ncbi:phage tail protein [uncultured Rhodoblastus sp.]|uniref:phage tail protein n=1 Tax=uncultured Rhodoblastus sp. TaxID=543037 RepID=UPI0025EA8EB2|nr:phage tail protein [uncultured Rhodoblastus sp.]
MGFLRAGNSNTQITKYSGLQVQTTSSSVPVPIIYGANILAPNCFWYQNFKAHPQHAGGKGGGKGGGRGGGGSTTSYTYSCSIMMGIGEGPIAGIGKIWQTSTMVVDLAALGLSLFAGYSPQSVWPYLSGAFPAQALTYPGVAYVSNSNYDLGASASVGDNNFEVFGILYGAGVNGQDADPALVISDFLTNPQYGVGFPAASIDATSLFANSGDSSYQTYCWANYLAISPVLNMQETASSILTRWLQLTNATAVWSGGLLKIIPYGDGEVTGGSASFQKTWTPNLTTAYDLTDEDYLHTDGEDPVRIMRSDPYLAHNQQAIEIQARSDSYNTGPIVAFDQAAINSYGLRIGSTITAHEICDLQVAQTSVQLILQRGLYIRNTFIFKLSMEFCLLDPMDLVTLTDPALGLNKTIVRIVEIEEDSDGAITVTAEEFPQGVATAALYPTQIKSNGVPDSSIAPQPVNTPIILEPPPLLTGNVPQLWLGASGRNGDPNWGGCVVWASLDGNSYAEIARIGSSARQGIASSTLPANSGANPDSFDTLAVDLTASGGALSSTSPASAAAGVTLCYVDGEYSSYTTATLTAANKYSLTGLYRGLAGSGASAHAAGATFCLLDSAILKYDVAASQIGRTIYLKFQSFNIFGSGVQDLSTCAAYPYTIQGTGANGPVAAALAVGASMDYGLVNASVAEADDFGGLSSPVTVIIDLGTTAS